MRKTILLLFLLFFQNAEGQRAGRHARHGSPKSEKMDSGEQLWKAEKLQKQLEKLVAEKNKGDVKSEIRQGPFGTLLIRAWSPQAYPGTGVMSTFVDRGAVAYGLHGDRDFADFVRAQGWLKAEPEVEDFMKLLDYAQFEAVVMNLAHLEEPTLKNESAGLVLRFVRGAMPNGAYPTQVIVEKSGPVKVIQLADRKRGR